MKIVKIIILTLFTLPILWLNISLYLESNEPVEIQKDILKQLNFLETELKENELGYKMQEVFPEGFIFVNSLYGLSWCELALADEYGNQELKEKAINEALFAFNEVNSIEAKYQFEGSLKPEYGAYYFGWRNYILSKILLLDTTFQDSERYISLYRGYCEELNEVLINSDLPYLESYSNHTWPADILTNIASLGNHDKIFEPKYEVTIQNWVSKTKNYLDTKHLMIPHKVDSKSGKALQMVRGSSMSLMLRLLSEIDKEFTQNQYRKYQSVLESTAFGLPSVREFPVGEEGEGDIDSGPVIFDVGFAATIVSLGTHAVCGNVEQAQRQYKTINTFGLVTSSSDKKKYLMGYLPMADAFIAWGRASVLAYLKADFSLGFLWAWRFHLISLSIIVFIFILLNFKLIVKKITHK